MKDDGEFAEKVVTLKQSAAFNSNQASREDFGG